MPVLVLHVLVVLAAVVITVWSPLQVGVEVAGAVLADLVLQLLQTVRRRRSQQGPPTS
jgi:hypothetical protein